MMVLPLTRMRQIVVNAPQNKRTTLGGKGSSHMDGQRKMYQYIYHGADYNFR